MTQHLYEALKESLRMFGIEPFSPVEYQGSQHIVESQIIAIVGLTGNKKGTITVEFDEEAFDKIVKTLMPGMDVEFSVKLSALSEIANMMSGNFLSRSKLLAVDITPPTMLVGKNIKAIIANIDTNYVSCSIDGGTIVIGMSFQ